jgi:hypothetical protein
MKLCATICLALASLPAVQLAAQESDLFTQDVRPILERRCLSCHNEDDRKGGLSLHSEEALRSGKMLRTVL